MLLIVILLSLTLLILSMIWISVLYAKWSHGPKKGDGE